MAGVAGNGKGASADVVSLTTALVPPATGKIGPATRALLPLAKPKPAAAETGAAPKVENFGGSATLIVLNADGELREHSTPHEALITVLQGTAKVKLRITPEAEPLAFTLQPGDALPMPAGAPHAVKALGTEPLKILLVKTRSDHQH